MSQENVEIIKAAFEAWVAGDMDALHEAFDPDVIVRYTEDFPGGPVVGREDAMRQWTEMRSIFDLDKLDAAFIGVGDRVVLVKFTWREMLGRVPTFLYTLRDAKIESIEAFWDHAEALGAAGLSEQDAHADS
jgi:ketosteroid isomerase-like protein